MQAVLSKYLETQKASAENHEVEEIKLINRADRAMVTSKPGTKSILCSVPVPPRTRLQPQQQKEEGTLRFIDIQFHNMPISVRNVKIVTRFLEDTPQFYTHLYRSYEDEIWHKTPRNNAGKHRRWIYTCNLCDKFMCSFYTLKGHLNTHFKFYPNSCKVCFKRYTCPHPLYKHMKRVHPAAVDR